MANCWYDEESVRKDLEFFQGGLNNKIQAIHERPPRVVLNEDEEVEDIRRQYGAIGPVNEGHVPRVPDLGGIQMMLNKVQLCDGNSDYSKQDKNTHDGLVLTKPNAASVPPKLEHKHKVLNPNVKEFVPISDSATVSQIIKTKYSKEAGSTSEIETLSNELKSKITSDGSFQGKLERNIALAKLLKLHSNQSLPKSQLKLLTPQDFHDPDEAFEIQPSKTPFEVHVKPENKEPSIDISAKDIADSISKVETWMQEGNKVNDSSRQRTIILDKENFNYKPTLTVPPTFKKVYPSSSETVQSSHTAASTPVPVSSRSSPRQFKPSGVASELYLKFQNNQKAAERQSETIWTRVEREMKEKEEKIKQNGLSD